MNAFHEGSFAQRQWAMGDTAEGVFEDTESAKGRGWARYGLNRPKINLAKVPPNIRFTPDYVQSHRLVEVQAFGHDGLLKVKEDKLEALLWWDETFNVDMFVWDSAKKAYGEMAVYPYLWLQCRHIAKRRTFESDGKAYFELPREALGLEWQEFTGDLR